MLFYHNSEDSLFLIFYPLKGERVDEVINNLPTGNFYHKSQRTRERECNTDLEKCLEEPGLLKSYNEKEICGKKKTFFVITLIIKIILIFS